MVKKGLEQVRSRQRVLRRARPRAARRIGHARGETLVVRLHRHVQYPGELRGKTPRDAGLLALVAAERYRQADDDQLGLVLAHGPRDLCGIRRDHAERASERLARVADRAADAGSAMV